MSFGILYDFVYMATRAECFFTSCFCDRFRGCTFRGTSCDDQNIATERRECLARTGFTTSGDRGKIGLQPSCLEPCSRVDQFIHVTEHTRQEGRAREGPLHGEELFHLLKTVMQGGPHSRHAVCTDTADEDLVTPLENFVTAAYRELDLGYNCFVF